MPDAAPLAQYGAVGIVLAVVLGLFLWAFKRLFEHVLASQVDHKRFMEESVKAMHDIRDTIQHGNAEVIARMETLANRNYEKLTSK